MGLPRIIERLLDPRSYPFPAERIELIQTHISFILLTPEYVYKIKKPVDFGFLDFTTLEKRRLFCEEEVRLNRRLAPGIYLGVVPIVDMGGVLIEAEGEPVEYAVKMKRIPDDAILDRALSEGKVSPETIERIAGVLARFHRGAETNSKISSFGTPAAIGRNTTENFCQTADFIGKTISKEKYGLIKDYTEGFISANKGLFERRVSEGFIRDCHGDIHCEHIALTDGIGIFDCIEFNERFRYSDVISDVAFLSMDLDFRNRRDLAAVLERAYLAASGDSEGGGLMDFYKCYRAYVRGKVAGFKYMEPEVSEEGRMEALIDAKRHFHLAGIYAAGVFTPALVIVRGLSGTGKSRIAKAIAQAFDFVRFSSDAVRKELAGLEPGQKSIEAYGKGIYSPEFTERTYAALIQRGISMLKEGRSVVLDATFLKQPQADALLSALNEAGLASVRPFVIECVAPEELVRQRLMSREKGLHLSDARWDTYIQQKKSRDRLAAPDLEIDTSLPVSKNILRIAEKLFN